MTADPWAAFLAARLDDDEAYARTMTGAAVRNAADVTPDDLAAVSAVISRLAAGFMAKPEVATLMERYVDDGALPPDSPERILREVAASRLLLEKYGQLLRMKEAHGKAAAELAAAIEHEGRTGEWTLPGYPDVQRRGIQREGDYLGWMVPAVRELIKAKAAVWSGHPDYAALAAAA